MKGASAGEGLGNQFLSHIREVDAIVQVVRCFESGDIHHVSGTIDPVRDIEVINTELILGRPRFAAETASTACKRKSAPDRRSRKPKTAVIEKLLPHLDSGKPGDHTLQLTR